MRQISLVKGVFFESIKKIVKQDYYRAQLFILFNPCPATPIYIRFQTNYRSVQESCENYYYNRTTIFEIDNS